MTSTMRAASAPRGFAALSPWVRRAVVLLLGVMVLGAAGVALSFSPAGARLLAAPSGAHRAGAEFYRVTHRAVPVTVRARGDLESSRSREVVNQVEGQSTILFIKPDGSMVKKGELVCELNSATLRDNLTNQVITVRQAEADLDNAVKTREVAEFALQEYLGGTYPQAMEDAQIALKLAQSNLAQAVVRFEWSSRMAAKGFVPRSQNIADRDSKRNCEIALQSARTQIQVLSTYTRQKTMTELRAAIEKARSDEMAKRATLGLEQTKQKKFETQIAKCRMVAPADGMITIANDDMMRPGNSQTMVEEGATVRERQVLLRLPDPAHMRVNTKIDESLVSRVVPGERARIRIDAFPGRLFEGSVERVQRMADPPQPPLFETRVYTSMVAIDDPPPSIRPGMTAKVEILIRQTDVLAVPVQSVLHARDKSFVFVAAPGGPVRHEVTLGTSNDELIEVADGLGEGYEVALNPLDLMTDAEKRDEFVVGALAPREEESWAEARVGTTPGSQPDASVQGQ
jgi:RND family efflux transporter MFP subunit